MQLLSCRSKVVDCQLISTYQDNTIPELEIEADDSTKVLVPLYGHVGFGNSLLHSDGEREIFNTMVPRLISEGIPVFGDEDYLMYMIRQYESDRDAFPTFESFYPNMLDVFRKFQ
jgi:hypothetical protein